MIITQFKITQREHPYITSDIDYAGVPYLTRELAWAMENLPHIMRQASHPNQDARVDVLVNKDGISIVTYGVPMAVVDLAVTVVQSLANLMQITIVSIDTHNIGEN